MFRHKTNSIKLPLTKNRVYIHTYYTLSRTHARVHANKTTKYRLSSRITHKPPFIHPTPSPSTEFCPRHTPSICEQHLYCMEYIFHPNLQNRLSKTNHIRHPRPSSSSSSSSALSYVVSRILHTLPAVLCVSHIHFFVWFASANPERTKNITHARTPIKTHTQTPFKTMLEMRTV